MCGRPAWVSAKATASRWTTYLARGKNGRSLEIGIPAQVVDVQVREEDDVDLVARHPERLDRLGQPALVLRGPVPQPRRSNSGVDENSHLLGPNEEAGARQAPALIGEELGVERPVRLPRLGRDLRIELAVLAEHADRVRDRVQLDRTDCHGAPTPLPTVRTGGTGAGSEGRRRDRRRCGSPRRPAARR